MASKLRKNVDFRISDESGNTDVWVIHGLELEWRVDEQKWYTEDQDMWSGSADSITGTILDFLACRMGLHPDDCYVEADHHG